MAAEEPPTLVGALAQVWQRIPERTALVRCRHRLTYTELERAVHRLVATYRRLGVPPSGRIVCSVAKRREHVVATAAVRACGADSLPRDALWVFRSSKA